MHQSLFIVLFILLILEAKASHVNDPFEFWVGCEIGNMELYITRGVDVGLCPSPPLLMYNPSFARTSKRHSYGFSVLSRWKRISSTFREILTGKRLLYKTRCVSKSLTNWCRIHRGSIKKYENHKNMNGTGTVQLDNSKIRLESADYIWNQSPV